MSQGKKRAYKKRDPQSRRKMASHGEVSAWAEMVRNERGVQRCSRRYAEALVVTPRFDDVRAED